MGEHDVSLVARWLTLDRLSRQARYQETLAHLARHSCEGLEVAKDVALAELSLLPYQQMLSQHALHLSLVRLLQAHHHAAEHAKVTLGVNVHSRPVLTLMLMGTESDKVGSSYNTSERNAMCVQDNINRQ